jgi:hypothetical protein
LFHSSIRFPVNSSASDDFHEDLPRKTLAVLASQREKTPWSWREVRHSLESLKSLPAFTQGSLPIHTFFPLPTCQTVQFPIIGTASTIAFHPTKLLFPNLLGNLNHSLIDLFPKYLDFRTLPHSMELCINLHKLLAPRDLQNQFKFLMPHPPISLGIDNRAHLTRGMPPESLLPTHRK